MRRRCAALLVALLPAWAQAQAQAPAKPVRIGVLSLGLPRTSPPVQLFMQEMRALGYVEGHSLVLEYRHAEGDVERLAPMAAELVRQNVDAIVTEGNAAALAAKNATPHIPIVMAAAGDPVKAGVVESLARPGGNVTGMTLIHPELSAKRLQLLKEAAPGIARVAVIWNPSNSASGELLRETQVAARALGLQLQPVGVHTPAQLDAAFADVTAARVSALITLGDGMLWSQRARIVDFATRQRVPTMFPDREFAEAGGLMVYGPNAAESIRRAALLVDKVLKGAKPADLPIEQPTQMELLLNLRTARALGLSVPRSLMVRADRVIE